MAEALQPQANASTGESLSTNTTTTSHPGDQYPVPEFEEHGTFTSLKERIKKHYELASDYYYSLWGEHIHHGYFESGNETKEQAQIQLITLLLSTSQLAPHSRVLDVGCGLGGTSRYLAQHHSCTVTGITISGHQVSLAHKLSTQQLPPDALSRVNFLELDAETMDTRFPPASFDAVWISEALSHLPNKPLFFRNAARVLAPGGKLVIADWFKAENLTPKDVEQDISLIEDGMLLPPLCTQNEYVALARDAGLSVFHEPRDISAQVAKTWDISWSLVSSPSLWAFAIAQGRDGLAFLQAFRAMRRGYADGTFRYAVMAFTKAEGEKAAE